jgi:hypothetical protein
MGVKIYLDPRNKDNGHFDMDESKYFGWIGARNQAANQNK